MAKDKEENKIRLKITKKKSGTYSIESLSIKDLRKLDEVIGKRKWWISQNGLNIYLETKPDK